MNEKQKIAAELRKAGWTNKKGLWFCTKRGLKAYTRYGLIMDEAKTFLPSQWGG